MTWDWVQHYSLTVLGKSMVNAVDHEMESEDFGVPKEVEVIVLVEPEPVQNVLLERPAESAYYKVKRTPLKVPWASVEQMRDRRYPAADHQRV